MKKYIIILVIGLLSCKKQTVQPAQVIEPTPTPIEKPKVLDISGHWMSLYVYKNSVMIKTPYNVYKGDTIKIDANGDMGYPSLKNLRLIITIDGKITEQVSNVDWYSNKFIID